MSVSSTDWVLKSLLLFLLWLAGPVLASAQSWQSVGVVATAAGGSSFVNDAAPDGAGGYVATGGFQGTVTLGNFVLTSAGSQDLFVARFDAAGNCTQAVRAGGTGYERAAALALDASGAISIIGEFDSPMLVLGSITLANAATTGMGTQASTDVFVARLSAAGQWTQAVRGGGPNNDSASDIALDSNGTTVVVGSFVGGAATFGSISLTNMASSGAFFVGRLSSAGTWSQAVSATSNGAPHLATSVALDASGNALVAGYFYSGGTLAFGSTTLRNPSASTVVFVARLSRTGVWTQAAQSVNSGGFAFSGPIAADASGNAVLAGTFVDNNVSFGNTTLTYRGTGGTFRNTNNLFVARLSNTGTWTYAAQPSGINNSTPAGIAFDVSGNVLLAGSFGSPTLTLGTATLLNSNPGASAQAPSDDIFVGRLNSAGQWNYVLQAGGTGDESPNALVLDGSGALVAGSFGPTSASFGAITVATPARYAGFLARIGGSPLGTTAAAHLMPMVLAPNPAGGSSILHLAPDALPRQLLLLDALGRPVRTYPLPARAATAVLDLAELPPGLYVVRCGATSGQLVVE